ncbi:MAG: restriction endonuclease subunit S [Kiritimatiellae bacterium]|jgi:type I restriction enzyme S subunit|nr:restriction endonuclease subunit S [Kiritimatiellia bacterium]
MKNNWKIVPASEFCNSVRDGTHDSPKQVEYGKLLVTSRHITGNRLDLSSAYNISSEDYESINKRSNVDQWDVLFTMIGTVGEPCLVSSKPDYAIKNIGLFKSKTETHGKYLYYYLCSPEAQHHTESHSQGTTQQYIPLGELRKFPIYYPEDENEMLAITHILGSLDDKIDLNRRMNEALEGMAQTLFKSWFVDFDPVIDNILLRNLKEYPSPSLSQGERDNSLKGKASPSLSQRERDAGSSTIGRSGDEGSENRLFNGIPEEFMERAETRYKALADGTANREVAKNFPDSFQETEEMGWIPEGWVTQSVYDMANFINGAAYKGKDFSVSAEALPVIKIAEIKGGITAQTKFTEINKGDKYIINDGDILLSWSGNPDTSIDTFIWTSGKGYLNQHIFKVSFHSKNDRYFVYYQLKILRSVFVEIARDKQTTGLGHFTAADMKRLRVFKPTYKMLSLFNEVVASIYKRSLDNNITTKNITKLRDTLLPKLISGELRIEDAEKMVGDIV